MYQDTESYQGQISLDGIYTPYCVNTWSGEVDEIGNYSYQDGRTVIDIAIQPGEVMVFALNPYQSSNPVVEKQNVEKVTVKNGNTILYVPQSGKTQITYADNTTYSTEVTVPEDIQLENWNLTVESWTPGDKVTRTEDKGYGYITTPKKQILKWERLSCFHGVNWNR